MLSPCGAGDLATLAVLGASRDVLRFSRDYEVPGLIPGWAYLRKALPPLNIPSGSSSYLN